MITALHHAVGPGKTVAVVGDGAVGLLGVLAAKQLGAELPSHGRTPRDQTPVTIHNRGVVADLNETLG